MDDLNKTIEKYKTRVFVPDSRSYLLSLIYHLAYQRAEESGFDISDPAKSRGAKHYDEVAALAKEQGISLPLTLMGFHRFLKESGHGVAYLTLASTLQDHFRRKRKSLFLARVCAEEAGEMNLFIIRGLAVAKKAHGELIRRLRAHYAVLAVKDIPWAVRLTKGARMRGAKWNRGGLPAIAVVVFDPRPVVTSENDRERISPFVFNSRRSLTIYLKEWFIKTSGASAFADPVDCADNEAEALGCLPLFFSGHEQEDIFGRLSEMRRGVAAGER